MYAIVAVDYDWAIGNKGNLLYHIKGDMKYFRMRTMHHIVVMGRKTFESLPGQKPLPGRTNIILTRQKDLHYDFDNVIVMHSVEEVLDYCKGKECYCIGGEEMYKLFLPYCERAYVTMIRKRSDEADAYFPKLYNDIDWTLLYDTCITKENDVYYDYRVYSRIPSV